MKGRVTPYKKVGNRVVAWRVFLELGEGPDGKRQRWTEVVRGTKDEAEAVRVRKEAEVLAGTFVPRHVVTVKEWLKLWLEDYAPLKATAGTVEGYTRMCERHLIPALGAIRLTELTPEAVQRFYRQQRDRGLAGRTVLHQHRVLNAALKRAVRVGRLARNPLDRRGCTKGGGPSAQGRRRGGQRGLARRTSGLGAPPASSARAQNGCEAGRGARPTLVGR